MAFTLRTTLATAAITLGSASGAMALDLQDELALELQAAPATTRPATQPALVQVLPQPAELKLEYEQSTYRAPRVSGVELQGFHNLTSLAYRASTGTGLGLATLPGLTLTQGFVTSSGVHVNFYYVLPFGEPGDAAARALGYEMPELPDRTLGLRIGWRF